MNHTDKATSIDMLPTQINCIPSRGSRSMDAREAAEDLRLRPRLVQEWAGKGYLPAHPLGEGERKIWRFF